jgi:hypothetical protein
MDRIEYENQREWLRLNPTGFRARSVRSALIQYELEYGLTASSEAPKVTSHRGYVVIFHDRPGQPRGGRVVHSDYACPRNWHDDADIREATPDEKERLPRCKRCWQ